MKRRPIVVIVVLAVMFAVVFNPFGKNETIEQYDKEITEHRKKKNIFFQTDEGSPFMPDVSSFTGLNYYTPDLDYKIMARFEPIVNKQIRTLATSDNKKEQFLEYGYAVFELEGKENKLILLEVVGGELDGSLFLAFGDATSANETYGAGRYLDIEHDGGDEILLDFNYAYNPYCAYSEEYSCPFPLSENLLEVAIRAGEKNY